jgi:hypothetical protein
MIVSVINISGGRKSDAEVLGAIRAVNRQISEDFQPYWGFGAQLRLEGKTGRLKGGMDQADMRGDAVLYIRDKADTSQAEGYHDKYFRGIPYGFVFLELADTLDEPWTATFSHEALELVGDPESNLLVQGPHPTKKHHRAFYWFEMCDPVQCEYYAIDGIDVSNFLLPLYFTSSDEHGGRNDFLGTQTRGRTLQSFGVNPGGYAGYFDPKIGKDVTHYGPDDVLAKRRLSIKGKLKTGRGNLRQRRALA